jgi:hypothetical protein
MEEWRDEGYDVRTIGDIGWRGGRDGRFRQMNDVKQEKRRRVQDETQVKGTRRRNAADGAAM